MRRKKIVVFGAAGFIGHHLCNRLADEVNVEVMGFDINPLNPAYNKPSGWWFWQMDARDFTVTRNWIPQQCDEVYQLAADMGGAGYVFTGYHDADIMANNAQINISVARACAEKEAKRVFFSSSACIYPEHNQQDPANPVCVESSAYPAAPDSDYGWEKLFSERLWDAYRRNYNLDVRIARYHNIYGPECSWNDGREKAPAAMCRKVAEAKGVGGKIVEVWGDGKQTRSFLYIDDCLDATIALMHSEAPAIIGKRAVYNIGSERMITIDELVRIVATVAQKRIEVKHVGGPQGVRGRCSDNNLIGAAIGWNCEKIPLEKGLERLYQWIYEQIISGEVVAREEAN
jgi:nucleoside-diphosphate-sugar epimerase